MRTRTAYEVADGLSLDGIPGRLKRWRAEAGVSQEGLATLLGISRMTVNDWEHGGPVQHPAMLVLAMDSLIRRRIARGGRVGTPHTNGSATVK